MKRIVKKLYGLYRRYRWAQWGGLWNFIHGFKESTVSFCGINKNNWTDFVSDYDFHRMHPLNGPFSGIIDNKIYLPFLFKDYPDAIPEFFFFKDKFGFLPMCTGEVSIRIDSREFLSFLKSKSCLILKHTYSEVGRGFLMIKYKEGSYSVNNKLIQEEDLIDLLSSLNDYVVQEYVEQHDSISSINPTSLNTLRLLLFWNSEINSFVVGRCFQRFGCNGNVVDNLGSGNGILVYVNPVTGEYYNYGVMNVDGKGDLFVENIQHPNTGYVFEGNKVIGFEDITQQIIEMFNSISFLKFVALDVAITNDGFKIIETNSYPDPAVAQYKYGFMADPKISTFFKGL